MDESTLRYCPIMGDYLTDSECAEAILSIGPDMVIAHCRLCAPGKNTGNGNGNGQAQIPEPAPVAAPSNPVPLAEIRKFFTDSGWTVARLAPQVGCSESHLYGVFRGDLALSAALALRLQAQAEALVPGAGQMLSYHIDRAAGLHAVPPPPYRFPGLTVEERTALTGGGCRSPEPIPEPPVVRPPSLHFLRDLFRRHGFTMAGVARRLDRSPDYVRAVVCGYQKVTNDMARKLHAFAERLEPGSGEPLIYYIRRD